MQASRERAAVYNACSILAVSLRIKIGDAYLKKGFLLNYYMRIYIHNLQQDSIK